MIFSIARKLGSSWTNLASLRIVAVASVVVTGILLGVRHVGGLQPLELVAFDQLVRLRPQATQPDPRILVVTITEADIQAQERWPFSDEVYAQLLRRLQSFNPRVIGLDVYRDLPVAPGHDALVAQLQKPNTIAVQNLDTRVETPAPPSVPAERIGFNDFPIDPDDVVRRNILFAEGETGTLYSFSLQLALAYLAAEGISPQKSNVNPDYLQLGKAVFVPLKPNSGGYQAIDAEGYQVLLNYRSSGRAIRQVSFTQVLQGEIDPSWVNDKIVLVGSVAPSLKDSFSTPYSPILQEDHKLPGVLVHSEMVSQLLDATTGDRPLFWFWPEWGEIVWIVGWISVGGILGRITYHPLRLSVGAVLGLGALFEICLYLFTSAGWVPLVAPALGFVLTAGSVISYRADQAHKQQQMVMKLLGQNTSPEIAQALWKGRDRLLKSGKLPGIRLEATMFFADVKNFSTMAEQMTPEALLDWLNELLDVLTREVLKRRGIVNKFTGDGVMAVFGVPTSRLHKTEVAADAKAAVACALAVSDALDELNQEWQALGLPMIQMRIGIFTGPVVAGSLGGKDRLEYGIIGDSVNTAARLEGCEKHRQPTNCRILIGHETLVHLQGQFEVESWGPLALKGKQQMIHVYRVLGPLRDQPSLVATEESKS